MGRTFGSNPTTIDPVVVARQHTAPVPERNDCTKRFEDFLTLSG